MVRRSRLEDNFARRQYLLHYVTPLDAWKRGFRLQEIFSETPMKPSISRDLAYYLWVMGFRGSPVRIER